MPDPTTPTPDQLAQALGVTHGHEAAHPGCHRRWITYGDPTCGRGGQRDHEHTDTCRVPYVHECWGSVVHGPGHTCRCGAELSSAATATSTGAPGIDALVGRFNALSDAAGNPGAPTPPGTPEGALSYALGHAEREGRTLLQARDVLAGLTELGWTCTPTHSPDPAASYHLLNQRLNTVTAKLDAIAARLHDLDALARLWDGAMAEHHRLIPTDATARIRAVLTSGDRPGPAVNEDEAGDLAARIAQALYGPTTETAPTVDWFTRAGANDPTADVITRARRWLTHCGPDRGVSDTIAGMHLARLVGELLEAIPDEGAPTEGDPLPPLAVGDLLEITMRDAGPGRYRVTAVHEGGGYDVERIDRVSTT